MAILNTFTDRVVEHPGRYLLTPTGTQDEYDLSRAEGTVTEPGTPLNAANLNPLVNEINDINDKLDGLVIVERYTETTSGLEPISPGDNTYYVDFDSVPVGYTAIGIVGVNTSGTGSSNLRLRGFFLGTNRAGLKIRSEAGADLTAITLAVDVLYIRTGGA